MATMENILAYAVMPTLSAVGFYGSMYLAIDNGLCASLLDIATGRRDVLPNTKQKVITRWTGIKPIDTYLSFYIAFFLPGANRYSAMAMQNRHFLTQYAAMWALVQLQTHRKENSALVRSSLLLTGFGVQTLGAATAIPLFCALHLATSALSGEFLDFGTVAPARTSAIPASVVLSILMPVLIASSYKPGLVKQSFWNVWQLYYLVSKLTERLSLFHFSKPDIAVYNFAEGLSTVSHLAIVGSMLLSNFAPSLLPPRQRHLSFKEAFWPRFSLARQDDMMERRLHFLRWDEVISCLAFVLWAAACYVLASPNSLTATEAVKLGAQIIARACITGPVGAAAWLLRARDASLAVS